MVGTEPHRASHAPPRLAIAMVSSCVIAYEILLMRLFSIIQWHHFAYMVISLAMLGFGASGTFLFFWREPLRRHFPAAFLGNIFLFALTLPAGFLLGQRLPFNAEQILWDLRQPFYLGLLSLLLALPFFFAANCIALAFIRFQTRISRIYAMDLLGAGGGSLLVLLFLYLFFPMTVLKIISAGAILAGGVAWYELYRTRSSPLFLMAFLAVLPFCLPPTWTAITMSPYKGLSQLLEVPGTRIERTASSPLGLLTVVASPTIPLRHAPGLSLNAVDATIPEQRGVFTDGAGMTAINKARGRDSYAFLDQMTSALPYHLASPERILVVGGGGGSDVLRARYHRVPEIEVLEINPRMADLVQSDYDTFSGGVYTGPEVTLHIREARGFITTAGSPYDLIDLPLPSAGAGTAALYTLHENYLLTVEALTTYLDHVREGGYLALNCWTRLPPRETLKIFATAVAALERQGVAEPGRHLLFIRSWQTATLLVKKGEVNSREIGRLREFCARRSFDLCYFPGMEPGEANRFNVVRGALFAEGARSLLGPDREDFLERYKFRIEPATDNSPYFFHFFKWAILPEILSLRGQGGVVLLEWGYLVLLATLLQALVLSLVFILFPLVVHKRGQKGRAGTGILRVFVYFGALGLAFLFLEIAFIQKLILFVSHPIYAAAVTLASFLVFAGLGSSVADRTGRGNRGRREARRAILLVCGTGALYLVILDLLLKNLIALPLGVKMGLSVLFIAPLAYNMGKIFPLGLEAMSRRMPQLVPWAWAVNGCTSVLSSVLATLMAIHAGFAAVVLASLVLYGLAYVSFPAGDS